jgi:TonB family protein
VSIFFRRLESRYLLLSAVFHLLLLLSVLLYRTISPTSNIVVVPESSKEFLVDVNEILPNKNQVVESTKITPSKEITKDSYLSEQNQIVQEQRKAQNTTSFKESQRAQSMNQPSSKTKPQESSATGLTMQNLGKKFDFSPLGNRGPEQIAIQAGTSDYLETVKPGSETMLNTREFAYFSFYQRVRRQLEQFWEPGLRERIRKIYDRGRQIASERDHSTRLLVVMDDKGIIKRVQVKNTSGVLDLDEAAIEAFNKAGPFPNPPRGMVESDGLVRVEWEFVLRT